MARRIIVSFNSAEAGTEAILRFREFAEELRWAFGRERRLGRLLANDADLDIGVLQVTEIHESVFTRTVALVGLALKRHNLNQEARLEFPLQPSAESKLRAVERKARRTASLVRFLRTYGRRAQKGADPNDRHFDHDLQKAVKRMDPIELDRRLRDDDE